MAGWCQLSQNSSQNQSADGLMREAWIDNSGADLNVKKCNKKVQFLLAVHLLPLVSSSSSSMVTLSLWLKLWFCVTKKSTFSVSVTE